jgi:hypothetical protein
MKGAEVKGETGAVKKLMITPLPNGLGTVSDCPSVLRASASGDFPH